MTFTQSQDRPRVTAPGVVAKLREVLGLDPKASEHEVLDAVTAALASRKKKKDEE